MGNKKRRLRNYRQALFLCCLAALVVFGLWLYAARAGTIKAAFVSPDGNQRVSYRLEVAKTNSERAKGLMFRRELKPGRGMLFIFPDSKVRSFWMKNTYIPLDMLFISSDFKVVGILKDVPALNEMSRSVPVPSQYVVELAAGSVEKAGITDGWLLELKP